MNCYQCQKETEKNEFFPFCSSECKEEWNKDREPLRVKKQWTIPEIQVRLLEMKMEATKRMNLNQEKKIDGGGENLNNENIYDVAKMIFG